MSETIVNASLTNVWSGTLAAVARRAGRPIGNVGDHVVLVGRVTGASDFAVIIGDNPAVQWTSSLQMTNLRRHDGLVHSGDFVRGSEVFPFCGARGMSRSALVEAFGEAGFKRYLEAVGPMRQGWTQLGAALATLTHLQSVRSQSSTLAERLDDAQHARSMAQTRLEAVEAELAGLKARNAETLANLEDASMQLRDVAKSRAKLQEASDRLDIIISIFHRHKIDIMDRALQNRIVAQGGAALGGSTPGVSTAGLTAEEQRLIALARIAQTIMPSVLPTGDVTLGWAAGFLKHVAHGPHLASVTVRTPVFRSTFEGRPLFTDTFNMFLHQPGENYGIIGQTDGELGVYAAAYGKTVQLLLIEGTVSSRRYTSLGCLLANAMPGVDYMLMRPELARLGASLMPTDMGLHFCTVQLAGEPAAILGACDMALQSAHLGATIVFLVDSQQAVGLYPASSTSTSRRVQVLLGSWLRRHCGYFSTIQVVDAEAMVVCKVSRLGAWSALADEPSPEDPELTDTDLLLEDALDVSHAAGCLCYPVNAWLPQSDSGRRYYHAFEYLFGGHVLLDTRFAAEGAADAVAGVASAAGEGIVGVVAAVDHGVSGAYDELARLNARVDQSVAEQREGGDVGGAIAGMMSSWAVNVVRGTFGLFSW